MPMMQDVYLEWAEAKQRCLSGLLSPPSCFGKGPGAGGTGSSCNAEVPADGES